MLWAQWKCVDFLYFMLIYFHMNCNYIFCVICAVCYMHNLNLNSLVCQRSQFSKSTQLKSEVEKRSTNSPETEILSREKSWSLFIKHIVWKHQHIQLSWLTHLNEIYLSIDRNAAKTKDWLNLHHFFFTAVAKFYSFTVLLSVHRTINSTLLYEFY